MSCHRNQRLTCCGTAATQIGRPCLLLSKLVEISSEQARIHKTLRESKKEPNFSLLWVMKSINNTVGSVQYSRFSTICLTLPLKQNKPLFPTWKVDEV